ncbi:uncharacterized protein [Pseudorasbora parva]|uniref:uncharacterized protein isoform X2 n=1 Tax=Pseudorasbora parva TaxID=51549 RepID=UPI00351E1C28
MSDTHNLDRFKRRLKLLRAHHNKCENFTLQIVTPLQKEVFVPSLRRTKSDMSEDIHEETGESDSVESEVSSCAGLDPDYNPDCNGGSSCSEDLSPVKGGTYRLSGEEEEFEGSSSDDQIRGESSISTSVLKRQSKKGQGKRGREFNEGGCSDLISPQKSPAQCSEDEDEDGGSDVVDLSHRASHAMKPSPKRMKKRGKQTSKAKGGCSDLISPQKSPAQCSEDEDEDGGSDVVDLSHRASHAMKPSPKRMKKRGKQTSKAKGGCSDLISPQKSPAQCSEDEDEDGGSDVVDLSHRASHAMKPSPKRMKKRGEKVAKRGKLKETTRIILKRAWSEEERAAVHKHLGRFIAERRVPGKLECAKCLEEERALKARSWKDVKNFVYNAIVTLKRKAASRNIMF